MIGEHIRMLGAIVNLILGSMIAGHAFQRMKTFAYAFLRPIFDYIVLYNLLIFCLLITKYLAVNLGGRLLPRSMPSHAHLFALISVILGCGMVYTMWRIMRGFEDRVISRGAKIGVFIVIALLFIAFGIRYVMPESRADSDAILYIQISIGLGIVFAEIGLLCVSLLKKWKGIERDRARIGRLFGLFYLSRYGMFLIFVILLLLFGIPSEPVQGVIISGLFLIFNLLPVIWFKSFFQDYAEKMSNLFDSRPVLDEIIRNYHLSKREGEILKLILDGKNNRDIEEMLFISYHTVKNHVYNLYQKLGIKNRYELVHMVAKLQSKD